jgi:outer membrane protein OmpA-like peptidoglycan-associated protein
MRDFSQVRVHVGPEAAESARQVSALAYTVGSHIVFGDGQYAPSSGNGKRLLAHELAHVIQQGGSETGQALQTQVLQRDDDESGGDEGKEKKPKTPFDPPDQLGKCSVDIFHPKKFVNCCTEAIGDADICSDQIKSYIDSLRKRPCPEPAKRPDGTCCPLPMIWDGLKGRCSKTITALGNTPIKLCEPGEKPTLAGGCRKADDKPEDKPGQSGDAGQTQKTVTPNPPPDAPVRDPQGTGKTAAPPSGRPILHFNLDKPAAGTSGTESNLLLSLTPAGKSEWTSLVAQLKANPTWKFQLVGKASPEGPATYNLDLGKRRAQLVAKALMENGIDRSRIIEVAPECTKVESGIYTCGETDAAGPEDRQVKFVFAGASGATP